MCFPNFFFPQFSNPISNATTFRARNAEWLLSDFSVQFFGVGPSRRLSDDFEKSSKSTKRRKLLQIRECYSESEIQCAFLNILRRSGKTKIANDIMKLLPKDDDENNELPDKLSSSEMGKVTHKMIMSVVDGKVLTEKFGIILQAMTSGKRIDFIKFEKYCEGTAKLYVSLYEWFKMTVTVHKVLIHGSEVIENASLPIGQLTEEAQEANNKIFKRIREFNTRKISRMATNEDLGHKLLIMTDPYINYFRTLHENLTLPMKEEAQDLLIEDN